MRTADSPSNLFAQALALPEVQRAKLAAKLLASLDEHSPYGDDANSNDDSVKTEWTEEILARSDAFHSGESKPIEGAQARKAFLADLPSKESRE